MDEAGKPGDGYRFNLQLFAEKTEPATPRRREEARKKGQVARSGELSTALLLFGAAVAGSFFAPSIGNRLIRFVQTVFYDYAAVAELTPALLQRLFALMLITVLGAAAPIMAAAMFLGLGSQLLQVGFRVTFEGLRPRFSRINPVEGVKRVFSKRALVELLKSSLKIGIIGYLAYITLRGHVSSFIGLVQTTPARAAGYVGGLVYQLLIRIGLVLLFLSIWDYLYQRWEFEQSIRMTKQEVKEERRQTEGDPQVRAQLRSRQREIARNRIAAEVPQADVVVTNPTHVAVALRYDMDEMNAPTVVAKGAGYLARRIRELAEEHGVPIVENKPLARALYEQVEAGEEISADLYQAVAEVLAYVYRLRNRYGQ